MKRIVITVAAAMLLLSSCQKIEERIDELDERINAIEQTSIPGINQQISHIQSSLSLLYAADQELGDYIKALQVSAENLRKSISDTDTKIGEIKENLQQNISLAESDLTARIEALSTDIHTEIEQIDNTIVSLQESDKSLGTKISELETYTETGFSETEEWISVTFSTLEHYNELTEDIATVKTALEVTDKSISDLEIRIKNQISEDISAAVSATDSEIRAKIQEVTESYTAAIAKAKEEITAANTETFSTMLAATETGMKEWVTGQLSGYSTIAETNALVQEMKDEFNAELAAQKSYLTSLIDNLSASLESRITSNEDMLGDLKQEMSALQGNVADNAEAVEKNASLISQNAQKILDNTAAISENADIIEANSAAIKEISAAVAALKNSTDENFSKLASDIADNTREIAENAELISVNAEAISNNTKAIAQNSADIIKLEEELASVKSEITEAYKTAITTAISSFGGEIRGELAAEIAAVNTGIENAVASFNSDLESISARIDSHEEEIAAIKTRIENMQDQIDELLSAVRSISYLPKYSDGIATMIRNIGKDDGIVELDFMVSPESAVSELAEIWQTAVSVLAFYTQTRSVSFIELPVLTFEADAENGTVSLTASGKNLDNDFFIGNIGLSAVLKVSSGNIEISSDYFPMNAISEAIVDIPDKAFKDYMVRNFDTDKNTVITPDEAAMITEINCSGLGITNMDGIGSCVNLVSLNCSDNAIEELDITGLTALELLSCSDNSLSELDLSENSALTRIDCENNLLTRLVLRDDFDFETTLLSIDAETGLETSFGDAIIPEIGDYLIINGGKGIVFSVSGNSCKLVSAGQTKSVWEEGASGYLVPSVEYDDNGLLNMQEIKEFDSWETRFPACKWCDDYGRDWYLPAINELSDIYSQKSVLNSVLSEHGFTELASDRYWSSTRSNQYNLYCISFTTGEFVSTSYNRSASYYIRAVISIW